MDRIVLMPTQNAVLDRKRFYAQANSSDSFGTAVLTLADYVREAWDLFGSAKSIATDSQRLAALLLAVKEVGFSAASSADTVPILFRFAENALGSRELDVKLACSSLGSSTSSEGFLIRCVQSYENILAERGLLDPGRAYALLAQMRVFDAPVQVDATAVDLTPVQKAFFSSQDCVSLIQDAFVQGVRLGETVHAGTLLSAGRYAEPSAIEKAILSCVPAGEVVVATAHPLRLYDALAERLADKGFSCVANGSAAFSETCFARAMRLVIDLPAAKGPECAAAVSDFLANPFLGLNAAEAHAVDALIRSDRTLSWEDIRGILGAVSKDFYYLEELAEQTDAFPMLDYFKDRISLLPGMDDVSRQRERAAMDLFADVMGAGRDFGLDVLECLLLAADFKIPDIRIAGDGSCCVRFMRHEDAACWAPGSAGVLLACDMTTEEFFPPDQEDIASEALCALGVSPSFSASARAGRMFALLSAVPSEAFYVERRLKDEDGASLRPASVSNAFSGFECEIFQDEECAFTDFARGRSVQASDPGDLLLHEFDLPQDAKEALLPCAPVLSALQMERYLACPHLWFLEHGLRLKEIDEGFGASEEGSFCHAVLKRFYECFQEAGQDKVRPEDMDVALEIMDEVVSECLEEQRLTDLSESRLIPLSKTEEKRVDQIANNLRSFLRAETLLLPSFAPRYFEYEIPHVPLVSYAGFAVVGRIDRIDVDNQGRAVIVDYKTGAVDGSARSIPSGSPLEVCGRKLQLLIYAQIVRRVLGLDVVGVLYVGCGDKGFAMGVAEDFVSCVCPGLDVDILAPSSCGYESFSSYLDAVEERVAHELQKMLQGAIAPHPANDGVCAYCLAPKCPERRDAE